jgi:hypothetical protein
MTPWRRKDQELTAVFISNNAMEAEEVRCLLEGSGLTPMIFDAHLPTLNPFLGAPLGGVRILVPEDQVGRAAEVLREAGRLGAELPLTGKSRHPYMDIARGSRAYAIVLLVCAAAAIIVSVVALIRVVLDH